MTTPGPGNFASDSANVGVQAGIINGGVHYEVPDGASPRERFLSGLKFLEGGMPDIAHKLISEAMAGNGPGAGSYVNSKVRFYWLLTLLADRTRIQFTAEDRSKLDAAREQSLPDASSDWSRGIKLIFGLIDPIEASPAESVFILQELDQLAVRQRRLILRHLESFIEGSLKDQLWRREMSRVEAEREANDRKDRVWMFFEPEPARPRARLPEGTRASAADWFQAILAGLLGLAAASYIALVLLTHDGAVTLLAYALSIGAGGWKGVPSGLEWCSQVKLRRAEEWQRARVSGTTAPPDQGFADQVDKLFDRYFARYVPDGVNREVWLATTAGTRRYLRNEVADLYREQRITARQVAWLVRHLVGTVKRDWRPGPADHRGRFPVTGATKVAFSGAMLAFLVGSVGGIVTAIGANPAGAIPATLVIILAGAWSVRSWLFIGLERKRFAAEGQEYERCMADRQAAFRRWQEILADKPDDPEMAAWLDCDRKSLMEQAMRHHMMSPRDVIADAFIEAPAAGSRRARHSHGPWRYSRYRLLVFLLTTDGVRQVTADLDFEKAAFHGWTWTNYRYDAVTSVEIREHSDHRRTFELLLMNGDPISVQVTEPRTDLPAEENPESLSAALLDASGLTRALHVLEGIAAEGKEWIERTLSQGRTDSSSHGDKKAG